VTDQLLREAKEFAIWTVATPPPYRWPSNMVGQNLLDPAASYRHNSASRVAMSVRTSHCFFLI
jgi:hypothetical protein